MCAPHTAEQCANCCFPESAISEASPEMPTVVQNTETQSAQQPYQKTFRVRGIPHSCKRNEIEKIVKAALGLEDGGPGLKVYSLAFNPYRQAEEKVATISFANLASHLSNDVNKDEWRFPLPTLEPPQVFDEEDEEDTPC